MTWSEDGARLMRLVQNRGDERVLEVEDPGPGIATITVNEDNTLHYQSIHGYSGPDTFEYTISDGHGGTAKATVTIYVYEIVPG